MTIPNITNKQKEIILLLYRFRFLNRIQIQKLLKNKDHRNINIWLKDLTAKNYVGRIYDNSYQKNTLPAKYFIATNSVKYLKTLEDMDVSLLKKFRQEKRRSNNFIDKSILIGDIYLKLLNINTLDHANFKFYTQQDFPKDGVIRVLLPDFAYVYKAEKHLEHFVGEIFSEKMPRYAIRGRINKFIEYFENDEDRPTNIIFICKNDLTRAFIEKYIYRYIKDEGGINANFYTTTKDQIDQNGMEISLFKKAEID